LQRVGARRIRDVVVPRQIGQRDAAGECGARKKKEAREKRREKRDQRSSRTLFPLSSFMIED